MRVFMLGWEFPPFITGGLGIACQGLTKALSRSGLDITFVLPEAVDKNNRPAYLKMVGPKQNKQVNCAPLANNQVGQYHKHITFKKVPALVSSPYVSSTGAYVKQNDIGTSFTDKPASWAAQNNLVDAAYNYAALCVKLAAKEQFDIIHAHDWFTFPAGIEVAKATGKPLVVHVHSTEFDRAGEMGNQQIFQIESRGVHAANRVIAVSYLTKKIIQNRYLVDSAKIDVVHNGIDLNQLSDTAQEDGGGKVDVPNSKDEKIVLFLGRITMQKGPEYFLSAAKKVLEKQPDVKFLIAGNGDRLEYMVEQVAGQGLGDKVLFTGFLNSEDVGRAFRMASVYVMPSVSEPFGIAPLEAISNNVPVIVSKTAGVGEVLNNVLKVDFWDVNKMAEKIIAVLRYRPLSNTLRTGARKDIARLTWDKAAMDCFDVYLRTIGI